jgi:conjugal transfer pilus assembly protein TrbC
MTMIFCLIVSVKGFGYSFAERKTPPVMIFISFSMPDSNIKEWMKYAEQIHAPVILRGLVNNSFRQTILKITELTKDNRGGVQIDPILFKRFNITSVPAVVVWKENQCLPTQTCLASYDVIYGEVKLDYALERISLEKDSLSEVAFRYSKILRERHE